MGSGMQKKRVARKVQDRGATTALIFLPGESFCTSADDNPEKARREDVKETVVPTFQPHIARSHLFSDSAVMIIRALMPPR